MILTYENLLACTFSSASLRYLECSDFSRWCFMTIKINMELKDFSTSSSAAKVIDNDLF